MPTNSLDSTLALFWDGPRHGEQEEIPGRPSYIDIDVNETPIWDSITPLDTIPPSVPLKVVRYKRVAVSSIDPSVWRYDYVGEGW